MSYKKQKKLSLTGIETLKLSRQDIKELFLQYLEDGMHGLCFSAYEEGQEPGTVLEENQIDKRMNIIAPYIKWVRSFSCVEGNELIPQVARKYGLKTLVGAWLGKDKDMNEKEIEGLIALGEKGLVDVAAVGNEVMYRNDLTEEELLEKIYQVKKALPDIPVGYVDAYYEFSHRPALAEASDVILANCYPFWEECHIDYSLVYMKQMYQEAVMAGKGKKVIITETGWPSLGKSLGGAQPSPENAMRYFVNSQEWSRQGNIEMFYFSSFDESWKVGAEGDVGAYWGLWDREGNLKI